MTTQSGNFSFLKTHDVHLVRLGALAERYFHDDPNTCLIKLLQFGELLAQLVAAKTGLYKQDEESQADLLRRLRFDRALPPQVADLLHSLRILGNQATHGTGGTLGEALNALKYARQAGIWFHRTFGRDPSFVAGPFQPPSAPEDATASVLAELERLRPRPKVQRALFLLWGIFVEASQNGTLIALPPAQGPAQGGGLQTKLHL